MPIESCDISSAQSELSGTLNDEKAVGKLSIHKPSDDCPSAVRTAVIYNKYMEEFLKSEYRPDYFLDVLFLVVCRYNYYTVTVTHPNILLVDTANLHKKNHSIWL